MVVTLVTDSVQLADLSQLTTKQEVTVDNYYLCSNYKNTDYWLFKGQLITKIILSVTSVCYLPILLLAKCTEFDWPLHTKRGFFVKSIKVFLALNFTVDETTEILLLYFISGGQNFKDLIYDLTLHMCAPISSNFLIFLMLFETIFWELGFSSLENLQNSWFRDAF